MAERRMFAKTIIDSDAFLDMPLSTQALYFHLSMRADDEGFINNPRKIQRMLGASDDDLKVLITKKFIIPFESGIVVIKHWKVHNYIRGDRLKSTTYQKEAAMLTTKENGSYTIVAALPAAESDPDESPRQKAYRESSLPYSFEYKIKRAFTGERCPVCGCEMKRENEDGIATNNRIPTIQHNVPISKGGKHELGNISVICKECNITIQDKETGDLNAAEVIEKWDEICMSATCQAVGSQVAAKWPHRLGKDRIGKDRSGKVSVGEADTTPANLPNLYGEYNNVFLFDEDLRVLKDKLPDCWEDYIERLSRYMAKTGKKYENHRAVIEDWYAQDTQEKKQQSAGNNSQQAACQNPFLRMVQEGVV